MHRYDARFKLQVAKEACKTSTSVKAVARRHSPEASTVRRWVATYRLHGWRGFHRQAQFYDLPFKLAVPKNEPDGMSGGRPPPTSRSVMPARWGDGGACMLKAVPKRWHRLRRCPESR